MNLFAFGTPAASVGEPPVLIPVNTVPPVINNGATTEPVGTFMEITSTGTWDNAPDTYTYEWFVNGTTTGNTTNQFDSTPYNEGNQVRCDVVATNAFGSSTPPTSSNVITLTSP